MNAAHRDEDLLLLALLAFWCATGRRSRGGRRSPRSERLSRCGIVQASRERIDVELRLPLGKVVVEVVVIKLTATSVDASDIGCVPRCTRCGGPAAACLPSRCPRPGIATASALLPPVLKQRTLLGSKLCCSRIRGQCREGRGIATH